MQHAFWQQVTQFGLAGLIFGGFLCALKWVFDANGQLLRDMAKERSEWSIIYQGFIAELRDMNAATKDFQTQVREDHKESLKQHRELSEILERINGYKN